MRHLFDTRSALMVLALVIFAVPATAHAGEPFTGSGVSDAISVNVGDCFEEAKFTVSGEGTPLGQFTGTGWQRVSYCGAPDIEGDVTFTDENGDQLSIHYIGTQVDLFSYVCDLSATGGTGVYAGATVEATLEIPNYRLDHPFDMSFDGTIQFP